MYLTGHANAINTKPQTRLVKTLCRKPEHTTFAFCTFTVSSKHRFEAWLPDSSEDSLSADKPPDSTVTRKTWVKHAKASLLACGQAHLF